MTESRLLVGRQPVIGARAFARFGNLYPLVISIQIQISGRLLFVF